MLGDINSEMRIFRLTFIVLVPTVEITLNP